MDYVSRFGKAQLYKTHRAIVMKSISFFLSNPVTWAETDFLETVWEVCGDRCERVVLASVYKEPDTKKVAHNYRLFFHVGEKLLWSSGVNELVAQVEDKVRDGLG